MDATEAQAHDRVKNLELEAPPVVEAAGLPVPAAQTKINRKKARVVEADTLCAVRTPFRTCMYAFS